MICSRERSSYLSSLALETRKNLDAFSVHFFQALNPTLSPFPTIREREREGQKRKTSRLVPLALLESSDPRDRFSRSPSFARAAAREKKRPILCVQEIEEGDISKRPEHATPSTAFLDAVVHAGEVAVGTASVLEQRCCHHNHRVRFEASGLVFSDD